MVALLTSRVAEGKWYFVLHRPGVSARSRCISRRRAVAMIESGTHTPGISAADFGLPPHTALRYEQPAAALRPYVTSYLVLDTEPVDPPLTSEWMLPGWAQIWIILTRDPVTLTVRNRHYNAMPVAVLYGVTSRAMHATALGGVSIGIDVSPLGWARLFRQSSELLRDRVTPLDQLMPAALVEELVASLSASDRALEVKAVLDDFFTRHMTKPHRDEAVIAQVMRLICDPGMTSLDAAAAETGIPPHTLRRVSQRYFGFPPKTLMMRTRFLRAFVPMLLTRERTDQRAVPPTYHSRSHFLRDAERFLGMTVRRFMAVDTPYLDAALRARGMIFGAPTAALDDPPA
jgi:AraC-like DNA-binding protein